MFYGQNAIYKCWDVLEHRNYQELLANSFTQLRMKSKHWVGIKELGMNHII